MPSAAALRARYGDLVEERLGHSTLIHPDGRREIVHRLVEAALAGRDTSVAHEVWRWSVEHLKGPHGQCGCYPCRMDRGHGRMTEIPPPAEVPHDVLERAQARAHDALAEAGRMLEEREALMARASEVETERRMG